MRSRTASKCVSNARFQAFGDVKSASTAGFKGSASAGPLSFEAVILKQFKLQPTQSICSAPAQGDPFNHFKRKTITGWPVR